MSDAVNKPAHYNQGPIECIEAMQQILTHEEFRGFLKGNVFKYLWREKGKNGIEDLRKGKDYYDRLIDSFDESEPEQPKPTLNSDKIPDGYRKLNDSSIEPRQRGDLRWSIAEKRYIEIGFDEIGYANRDNWAACRRTTGEADAEWVDAVWPQDWGKPARFWPNFIYQDEGTPDHELWDLGTVAGYTADGYRKWLMERDGKISCQMYCQVKKNAGTLEQATQPPDGWRFLEVGEVIRKGDTDKSMEPVTNWWIGEVCGHNHDLLRRNRFEVGEKVVENTKQRICIVKEKIWRLESPFSYRVEMLDTKSERYFFPHHLAPYIEETT